MGKARLHGRSDTIHQRGDADISALGPEIRRREFGRVRVIPAIYPDADRDRNRTALAFDQEAGDFSRRAQQVVRPFERQASGERGSSRDRRIMKRKSGYQPQLRGRRRRRRIGQHQRRMKISRRRYPCPAAPTAPGTLLLGDNPQRPALPRPGAP